MKSPIKAPRSARGAPVRPEPANVGGRPKAAIDLKLVEDLSSLMCTDAELATGLGVNRATIARRKRTRAFREALDRGRDRGKMSLRRWQFEAAKRGNITAQIWLGKQYLGQEDVVKNEHSGSLLIRRYEGVDVDKV